MKKNVWTVYILLITIMLVPIVLLILMAFIPKQMALERGDFSLLLIASADSFVGRSTGRTNLFSNTNGYSLRFNDVILSEDEPLTKGIFEIDIRDANRRRWILLIKTPHGTPRPGKYPEASRFRFEPEGKPGLDFMAISSGYNKLEGWFEIFEFNQAGGKIKSLAIDFYQHATDYGPGSDPWEFGSIRYNSKVALTVKARRTISN